MRRLPVWIHCPTPAPAATVPPRAGLPIHLPSGNKLGALLYQRVRSPRVLRGPIARNRTQVSILLGCASCRYARPGILAGFNDKHTNAYPANDAVAARKVLRRRKSSQRHFAHDEAPRRQECLLKAACSPWGRPRRRPCPKQRSWACGRRVRPCARRCRFRAPFH